MKVSYRSHTLWLVWFVTVAALFGPAFTLMSEYHFDGGLNPDIESYLHMAKLDFEESPVRRYRPIVPLLAGLIDVVLGPLVEQVRPWTFPYEDFSLAFSFLLVNLGIMGLVSVVLYKLVGYVTDRPLTKALAILAVLSARWAVYFAGIPIVDSLYLLAICILLYAMIQRDGRLLVFSFIVGVISRESFLLFLPLLLFPMTSMRYRLLAGVSAALAVFLLKWGIDYYIGADMRVSIDRDLAHWHNISASIQRLFSFHGLYEVFSILGFWWLPATIGLWVVRLKKHRSIPRWAIAFCSCIVVHALLSTELARMLYLATPLLMMAVALGVDRVVDRSKAVLS